MNTARKEKAPRSRRSDPPDQRPQAATTGRPSTPSHPPEGAGQLAERRRAAGVTPKLQQEALARLKRIEGQVRGLQRMVEEERYCADVLTQVAAVHEALRGVGKLLMRNHLEHCVTGALRTGDPLEAEATWQEILDLMYRHAR